MFLRATDVLSFKGYASLYAHYPEGKVLVAHSPNLVVNSGKQFIANALVGRQPQPNFNYLAIGTGNVAVAVSQTRLSNEVARASLALSSVANTTDITIQAYFQSSRVNVYIREAGCFLPDLYGANQQPAGTANSGTMFARALLSYDNSGAAPNDITLEWRVEII